MSAPISVANARVVLHLQPQWNDSKAWLPVRFTLQREGEKGVSLRDMMDPNTSRRTVEYDAVFDSAQNPEDIASVESIRAIGNRVLSGGNAAIAAFGLDTSSLYNRQAIFSQTLRSLSRELKSLGDDSDVAISCCYVACTDTKMINMLNDRPINMKKNIILDSLMVGMSLDEIDAKLNEGSSLPYFAVLRFEHTTSSTGTGYLLLADWGNPTLSGNRKTTAADVSQFMQLLSTASSNFAGSRFAGKVFPDDNVLGSLLGNFLFGNSLTTYIVDVQMQHFGTELEVLEGIVCAETLRKVRLLQTSNFVDHRLQRSLAATKELKGEVGQLRNRLEEKEKLLSQASGKEEELRSRLQKMSLENESLCARVEDLENSLASSTKKADQHIGELTEKIARYKHDHKELLRDIGLKETKFQQEALELRSQLALAEEENRRLQTDDVTTKNRAENLQLEVARLKDQLKEANSRIEESTATAAGLSSELESTKAKTAALSDQLQAAATKHETLQKANADLTNTISDLRHQLQLMEMDKKGALKEMEFSRREVEAAVRQRDNETKGLERQIQALEKEIEILRRAAANGQERSKTSPSDFIAAERDTLLAEVTRLRNVVAQGPAETTKLDAVAKAAQEEFERINAARKSDKERWKSEKNELLRRLEGLEGELKNRQIAAVPAPKPAAAPRKKAVKKVSESSASESESEEEEEKRRPKKTTAKPKAAPSAKSKSSQIDPIPSAAPVPLETPDDDSVQMEIDPSPVGGIISTKKPAKEKAPTTKKRDKEKGKEEGKEKGGPKASKRKALAAEVDASPARDEEPTTKVKKTKISLNKKDSVKKPSDSGSTIGSQENMNLNIPGSQSQALDKFADGSTAASQIGDHATPTNSQTESSLAAPPVPGGASSMLPVPPKSALPGGGPRLGAGMVDPRKLQAILAGFNMDKLKSLK